MPVARSGSQSSGILLVLGEAGESMPSLGFDPRPPPGFGLLVCRCGGHWYSLLAHAYSASARSRSCSSSHASRARSRQSGWLSGHSASLAASIRSRRSAARSRGSGRTSRRRTPLGQCPERGLGFGDPPRPIPHLLHVMHDPRPRLVLPVPDNRGANLRGLVDVAHSVVSLSTSARTVASHLRHSPSCVPGSDQHRRHMPAAA